MAHVTVEWTANLEGSFDRMGLLRLIAAELRERSDGVFPTGGIRVRAQRLDEWVIADDSGPDDAFVNIEVKMGIGRELAFRTAFFDRLFEIVASSLEPVFAARPLALSLYVTEAEGLKRNGVHARLAGRPS